MVPTWSPFVPFVIPVLPSDLPMKLWPTEMKAPETSGPLPEALSCATIVFLKLNAPEATAIPPPLPPAPPTPTPINPPPGPPPFPAILLATVSLITVVVGPLL